MKKLFNNIGNKVKLLAKICAVIGIVIIFIGFILMLADDDTVMAGIAAMAGGLVTIISSWPLYAFGQITDDVAAIRKLQASPGIAVVNDLPEL